MTTVDELYEQRYSIHNQIRIAIVKMYGLLRDAERLCAQINTVPNDQKLTLLKVQSAWLDQVQVLRSTTQELRAEDKRLFAQINGLFSGSCEQ